jgi:hypothetical protein
MTAGGQVALSSARNSIRESPRGQYIQEIFQKTAALRHPEEPFSFVAAQDCDKLPAGLEDAYPLARLQLGMFFHNEFDPESAGEHDVFSFRLHAPFEFEKLQLAADRLIERHAILRTSFHLAEFSEPLQLIYRHAEAPFTSEDLRGATAPKQDDEIKRWIATAHKMPFERSVPPLVRFHVQRLTDESFQFFISFHHACLDGWSLAAVVTELFKEYLGLLHENNARVHAPPSCYRDFVVLEREALASVSGQRSSS